MQPCAECKTEHFIASGDKCLKCSMKQKKSAEIQKTKTQALLDYQKKQVVIPLEPIEPVILLEDFT